MVDCNNKDDDQIALIRIPSLPYGDFDPPYERFVEVSLSHNTMSQTRALNIFFMLMHFNILQGIINQNKNYCELSDSTETPEWFSHQSPGSSVKIQLPSDLRDDSSWVGIALFTSVVILENLNNVSSEQDDEVSIDFICGLDIIEVPRIKCPLNISQNLPEPLFHASSFGLKVLIPAGKLRDHLEGCRCIRASIRSKYNYFEFKMCGARVLYKQDLVKFIRASGKMKQISSLDEVESSRLYQVSLNIVFLYLFLSLSHTTQTRALNIIVIMYFNILQEVVHQNKHFFQFSNSTEIPEWFSHQNLGPSIRMQLPLDLHDNSSWIGIALFAVVVVHKDLNHQDYKVFIEFNCRSDLIQGPVDRRPLVFDISEFLPEILRHASSFSFKSLFQARQLRDHLKECSWISTLIKSNSPYVKIKMCGAGVVYKQDLEKFAQCRGEIKQRSQFQMGKVESSQSNDRLKGNLMSLLLRVYQVFPIH